MINELFFDTNEQYKFALITMGRAEYINEDDVVINLSDFKNSSNNQRMYNFSGFINRSFFFG